MPSSTQKQANTAKLTGALKSGHFPADKAGPAVKSMAKMPMDKLKHFMKMKEHMTDEQKRRLLVGLRKLKEEYTGNVGGETDIAYADNLQVNEDEFTANLRPEPKVILKTFDTKADFDSYVNQRRGIEMTPKELQTVAVMSELAEVPQPTAQNQQAPEAHEETADDTIRVQKSQTFRDEIQGADILSNFLAELDLGKEKPSNRDRFFLRYESTDTFGNNTTTVIKKLKEGNQFCWTAFSKYESAEDEGNPNRNN